MVAETGRSFLGHDFGAQQQLQSTADSVDDCWSRGIYSIRTTLPPGGGFTLRRVGRVMGVDYAYLARRIASAKREEAAYGLSVELLAVGAEFVYDDERLAAALQSAEGAAH